MNEPGFGAEDQVTRKARRIARYREEAARGAAVDEEALERLRRDQRNWATGAEGERLVAETLRLLERHGWLALHDVHWPGRPRANIDHIAIGPGGVVVIDAKHWSGKVEVRDGVLRQNGYARTDEVAGVVEAAGAVTALLSPGHRSAVRALLCVVAQEQPPTVVAGGAVVVGRWQLPELLLTLPPRLSPYDVADLGRFLTARLAAGSTSSGTAELDHGARGRGRSIGSGTSAARGRTSAARGRRRDGGYGATASPAGGARARGRAPSGGARARGRRSVGPALIRLGVFSVVLLVVARLLPLVLHGLVAAHR